jgi:hypothetical protein
MPPEVQVGTVLISEWPQLFGLDDQPYSGNWNIVKALDGFAIDRKIRAAGWHFFFVASEVKVLSFGVFGAQKLRKAMNRIFGKVSAQCFNGLEVTGIAAKHFLGLPYTIVSAHSRHVQKGCYLEGSETRRLNQRDGTGERD